MKVHPGMLMKTQGRNLETGNRKLETRGLRQVSAGVRAKPEQNLIRMAGMAANARYAFAGITPEVYENIGRASGHGIRDTGAGCQGL